MRSLPTDEQLEAVYQHARGTYPEECCGMLSQPKGSDPGVRRCDNQIAQSVEHGHSPAGRTEATGFAFGGADLLFLSHSLDTDHPVEIIYHSHPDVGAYFSAEDSRNAVHDGLPIYPVQHLVIDVTKDSVHGSILFAFSTDKRAYAAIKQFEQPRDHNHA